MNKKMLKSIIIIINIAVSLSCIFVPILERIQKYFHIGNIYGIYAFEYWILIFPIILLYCAVGIILLIRFLIKNKITFSKKYFFLIPSVILSFFLVFTEIMIIINNVYNPGMEIPIILIVIGMPALLFYYLNGDYKLYLSAILCFLFPCSVIISFGMMRGLMGI
jgi:hypothetical protein